MHGIISSIQTAKGFQELSSQCYRHFAKSGVCQFCYFHFPPVGAVDYDRVKIIVWLGYPNALVEAYREAGFIEDNPLILRLLAEKRPVWTKTVLGAHGATPNERAYLNLLNTCGVKDDLVIPVFGPGGRNGGYGIGFEDGATPVTAAKISEIQWVCQSAHLKYCELLDKKLDKPPELSAREADVLRLIARGRTNKQIAEKLEVASKTIETYLARTFAKLEVNDRMTAALRAISIGII